MSLGRRKELPDPGTGQPAHAGLIVHRYLNEHDEPTQKASLLKSARTATRNCRELYQEAYDRRCAEYPEKDHPSQSDHESFFVEVNHRLCVGLGNTSVIETGIALHHTYGVPIIPGSALKGVASHYADAFLGREDDRFRAGKQLHLVLFGDRDQGGFIVFHDAWIDPESLSDGPRRQDQGLLPDVMTPHHQDHNKGLARLVEAKDPRKETIDKATDFDDPTPIPFLSVRGKFHVVLSCPTLSRSGSDILGLAREVLEQAVSQIGVGAKTTSGYGRLQRWLPRRGR